MNRVPGTLAYLGFQITLAGAILYAVGSAVPAAEEATQSWGALMLVVGVLLGVAAVISTILPDRDILKRGE